MQPDFLQARYANLFRIGRNQYEMFLDFGQVDPDGKAEAVHTRIITAAAHGRLLLDLLAQAVADIERTPSPNSAGDLPS